MTPANGEPREVSPSEEVVVRGDDVESYAASEPDAWDRWNYERSDQLSTRVSYRYVPDDVYGVDELDHNGRWRVVPRYGSVWIRRASAAGWAPYTAGRWVRDPYYGWTWVDDAPWGWAPFHYGRWVYVDDYWGWAPGPDRRPPVLRAGAGRVLLRRPDLDRVRLRNAAARLDRRSAGANPVARGGARAASSAPRWFGWGGPRVTINQTVINNVNVYQNTHVRNGWWSSNRDPPSHAVRSRTLASRRPRMDRA